MQGWTIVTVAIFYLLLLFVVASFADRSRKSRSPRKPRPAIYALSLAVYCTSWTFFGSVGLAATSGLDFLAIYVGPILVITLGYPLFSHIIAVAKRERITSIADFIASRYGKSSAVGAFAAMIAVLGTVPYIALQLKAISASVDTMVLNYQPSLLGASGPPVDTSLFISLVLALFAILFGTRHADATEHQDGLMLAVATESIVKLMAFLTIGIFVTFFLFSGPADLVEQAQASPFVETNFYAGIDPARFAIFTLLSFCAFILLPRQFHVGVVENHSPAETRAARWLFPLYLIAINLFVIPVAVAGMLTFGSSVEADRYVLALPLQADAHLISMFVFIGGLSAATAMVIVASVALSIMISNNIVVPLMLRKEERGATFGSRKRRNMAGALLNIRRTAIFAMLVLAYVYFQAAGDSAALASIGLLSFAALAQFAPSFFIGLFWSKATSRGALWGMGSGFAVWFYTLFLPTLLPETSPILMQGPFGMSWLHPQALFGIDAEPLTHGVITSLVANTASFVLASKMRAATAIERMQASVFRIASRKTTDMPEQPGRPVSLAELKHSVANYLGHERAERAFGTFLKESGRGPSLDEFADHDAIMFAEQLLASAIGAASSRLVMSLLLQIHEGEAETTIRLLDDASEALQYNRDLLQTALDQVDQGISVFDREFRLSSWNSRFRTLLELPDELGQAGTPLNDIAAAIEDNAVQEKGARGLTEQLLSGRGAFSITMRDSGRIVEVDTREVPDGGHVISWNDTTERVNAARILQSANETLERRVRERTEELTRLNEDLAHAREAAEAANIGKTKFLAAVGHDILQPLNAARLYTSSLVEKLDREPSVELAENIDSALESVEDILGSVLAISRLDSGALTPNVTEFSCDRLMRRLESEFKPIANAKDLTLNVISNDFHVRSDYSLLRRLLQNLVSNAIKYTGSGTITLDAKIRGSFMVFEVRDTGSGIAEADRELIFEEFRRLEAGKKAAPGLGLGLSIVRRLAATLGHQLDLTTKEGAGSSFFVSAPLVLNPARDAPAGSAPATHADHDGLVVVCLDNEERILDGMRHLLGGWGCQVHVFSQPEDMLAALPRLNAHILIADYHLDTGTGVDAVLQARSAAPQPFTAVLVTADRSSAVRKQARAAEMIVLNKPVKPAALRAILSQAGKNGQIAARGTERQKTLQDA